MQLKIHNMPPYIAEWRVDGRWIREVFLIEKNKANGAVTMTMKTMSAIIRSEICNIPYGHTTFI